MIPQRFIPPDPDKQNDAGAKAAAAALAAYQRTMADLLPDDRLAQDDDLESQMVALLRDMMHLSDRRGILFVNTYFAGITQYSYNTDEKGTAGSAYDAMCELVATACGYEAGGFLCPVTHPDTDKAWSNWRDCCRDNGIALDPPDSYEIAARAAGWTTIAEGGHDGNLICKRADLGTRQGPEYGSWEECCTKQGIETDEAPTLDDRMHLRLTLELRYNGADSFEGIMEENLGFWADALPEAERLTQGTHAKIVDTRFTIERSL